MSAVVDFRRRRRRSRRSLCLAEIDEILFCVNGGLFLLLGLLGMGWIGVEILGLEGLISDDGGDGEDLLGFDFRGRAVAGES